MTEEGPLTIFIPEPSGYADSFSRDHQGCMKNAEDKTKQLTIHLARLVGWCALMPTLLAFLFILWVQGIGKILRNSSQRQF